MVRINLNLSYEEVKALLCAGVCFGIKKDDFISYLRCLDNKQLSYIKRTKEFKTLNSFFVVF